MWKLFIIISIIYLDGTYGQGLYIYFFFHKLLLLRLTFKIHKLDDNKNRYYNDLFFFSDSEFN